MGQLSDPFQQGEDDGLGITISGLPGEPDDLEPTDEPVDAVAADVDVDGDTRRDDDTPRDDDEVVFDLDDWSEIERQAVGDRLRAAAIPHAWEGTSLSVAAVDEAPTENILDLVEGEAEPQLDGSRDQVAYDLSEWDEVQVTALVDELTGAAIAYAWDGDELYVYAEDEEATDDLFERVSNPDELDPQTDTGTAGADTLGEIFVAADRLQHGGDDNDGSLTMLEMAKSLDAGSPPYGLPPGDWTRLCERVSSLADLLTEDTVDEDAVMEEARDLRTALRPYV